jgi:hypothetical protein
LRTTRSTQEQRIEDNAFHPVDRLVSRRWCARLGENKSQVDRLVLKTIVPTDGREQRVEDNAFHPGATALRTTRSTLATQDIEISMVKFPLAFLNCDLQALTPCPVRRA